MAGPGPAMRGTTRESKKVPGDRNSDKEIVTIWPRARNPILKFAFATVPRKNAGPVKVESLFCAQSEEKRRSGQS